MRHLSRGDVFLRRRTAHPAMSRPSVTTPANAPARATSYRPPVRGGMMLPSSWSPTVTVESVEPLSSAFASSLEPVTEMVAPSGVLVALIIQYEPAAGAS